MAFDPLSWAFGFTATRFALNLGDCLFRSDFRTRLHSAAREWSEKLPSSVVTPPESVFTELPGSLDDYELPARAHLQSVLINKRRVPSKEEWLDALMENWHRKREVLGSDANVFFQQSEESAREYLADLAEMMFRVCVQDTGLFQSSALHQLGKLEQMQTQIMVTQSNIINEIKLQRLNKQNHFGPHHAQSRAFVPNILNPALLTLPALCFLNHVVCVDGPTDLISGVLRTRQTWIGIGGTPVEEARYVPPSPEVVPERLDTLLAGWNEAYSTLDESPKEDVVIELALFHHGFVSLHPFEDGNGRVARCVLDYQAGALLGVRHPLRLKRQGPYYEALFAADQDNLSEMIQLISRSAGI